MSRIIEVLLFLTPFLAYALWRLSVRTPVIPASFLVCLGLLVALMLAGLLWSRYRLAGDAQDRYVPAQIEHGVIVPGGPRKGP
ncbi:MAG TPA: DUF6111 family protein [Rhodopila sp.]|uniref:DUF6111 family protein n=1 Tax=Rhodopila sp. TaxID=2480087 RepID=UPI002C08D70A|nr:DUF6111 family protein [Rhodopila sp.]HVY17047.1 DUF6111 family protein [Rhodopila sp.]